ncbi:NACHT, LRR and PYD domains-containing protein 12-like isoform X2 [Periophthalmus magnuspinnatus]|uniref:NACHT, LRR and PYD domains-containing protein 12-like isoform X2 n=1 Tax=Periophthalmus magnuspinnatus TaxID=409849 RepID=UPI00145A8873|nr:NACHT, LRR and PYD domains-containing protein 12-like isoform X2 [Periophthalmus magnuspinnatus]
MEEQQGPPGPGPSCVSARSDHSMANPISFQKQIQQGALPSACSSVSLNRDGSMEHPNEFKSNTQSLEGRSDMGLNQTASGLECSSSDVYGDQDRSEFKYHKSQSHIMKELKVAIEAFLESELNRLDKILSEEIVVDPEESTGEDEDMKSSREAVLHLSTHFLRKMNQEPLAQCLLIRSKAVKSMLKLKSRLKRRFNHVFEGVNRAGHQTDLSQIYTDLWMTEGDNECVNIEHEVCQIQTDARKHRDKPVKCQEMFGNSLCGGQLARTMLMKGVAGIGKTLCVQKVVLDWAEDKAHHNIRFMLPFSFRELNVLRDKSFSLVGFLQHFFVELEEAGICSFDDVRVVLIFDGLDESRLNLDFHNCPSLTDTTKSAPLEVLLVNLIRGKLLPFTRLWITTRPAAANQIPAECVTVVTEVRGFTDPQKEQYFQKRFEDKQATVIINHMKTNRSLHNMCYIPIFCWILSTVLKHVMETGTVSRLPHTLTQIYIHLLVVHTRVKSRKYDGRSEMDPPWTPETKKMVKCLGKLAFEQLQRGNLIFYESDLRQCGLNTAEASVYSGVVTQVFREEQGLHWDKVYCFIHLSVQEFLAALYVHLTFFNSGVSLLSEAPSTKPKLKPVNDRGAEKAFYRSAVDTALQSRNGHFDLFLRFLLGLSLQNNQNLLQGLTKHIQPSSHSSKEAAEYIKNKISEGLPLNMTINLFQCLNELGDASLLEEVQRFLSSGHLSGERMSPVHWSALVFTLLLDKCEVFELRKFGCSEEAFFRLLPVIKMSMKSSLTGFTLSNPCCKALANMLRSESCLIKNLDLSYTELQDSGLSTLANGLMNPPSNLQVLRLRGCKLTQDSCRVLCSVLSSPLTQLDVSDNCLQDQGVKMLLEALRSSLCNLTTLRMSGCDLTSRSCEDLSAVLQCHRSALRDLDLSNNQLQDLGIEFLCCGLVSPHCTLEILRLVGCLVTDKGVSLLRSVLHSCRLRELDLRYNHPGDLDKLSAAQKQPACSLTMLKTGHGGVCRLSPGPKKYTCKLTLDLNTAHRGLLWFENNCVVDGNVEETPDQKEEDNFEFWHQVMCSEGLREHCYWEVKWRGLVSIAVTYRGIQRKGKNKDSMLGGNCLSWALDCSAGYYVAWHNNKGKIIPRRVGRRCYREDAECTVAVYLDWEEGVLSFFEVLPSGLKLIHNFHCAFSEPLFPAFRLRSEYTEDICNSVTVCSAHT